MRLPYCRWADNHRPCYHNVNASRWYLLNSILLFIARALITVVHAHLLQRVSSQLPMCTTLRMLEFRMPVPLCRPLENLHLISWVTCLMCISGVHRQCGATRMVTQWLQQIVYLQNSSSHQLQTSTRPPTYSRLTLFRQHSFLHVCWTACANSLCTDMDTSMPVVCTSFSTALMCWARQSILKQVLKWHNWTAFTGFTVLINGLKQC